MSKNCFILDLLDKKNENGKFIIPSTEDLLGEVRCLGCNLKITAHYPDLHEYIKHVEADVNFAEMILYCPNEDCDKLLRISYSRSDVECIDEGWGY